MIYTWHMVDFSTCFCMFTGGYTSTYSFFGREDDEKNNGTLIGYSNFRHFPFFWNGPRRMGIVLAKMGDDGCTVGNLCAKVINIFEHIIKWGMTYMEVSWNRGSTKSSFLMVFSITKTIQLLGVPSFMETPIWVYMEVVDGFNPFFQPDLWDGFSANDQ